MFKRTTSVSTRKSKAPLLIRSRVHCLATKTIERPSATEASKKENNAKSSVFNKKHHFLANISNKLGLSSVIYFK